MGSMGELQEHGKISAKEDTLTRIGQAGLGEVAAAAASPVAMESGFEAGWPPPAAA